MATEDLNSLTRDELAAQYGVEMARKDEMVAAAQQVVAEREQNAQAGVQAAAETRAALEGTDLTKGALVEAAGELGVEGRSSMGVPDLAQAIVEAVQPVAQPAADPTQAPQAEDGTAGFPEQPPAGQLPPR